jgi:uncharacterized membrane protein
MVIPNVATSVGSELVAYGLLAVYIHSGRLRYGLLTTFLFLVGSLYWTLVLENFGVLMSFFSYTGANPGSSPLYLVWVGLTPLWVPVGWFDVTFPTYMLIGEAVPKAGMWAKAAAGGLVATSLDLMIDPGATASGLWRWTHPSIYFLGVPITNYVAWFLLVALYIAAFESVAKGKAFASARQTAFRLIKRLAIFQAVFVAVYVPILYAVAKIAALV